MNIPDFIQELVEHGIDVVLQKGGEFYIEGFYKSSGVTVSYNEGREVWIATARYDEETEIYHLEDLVQLNYSWWQMSKERFDGWAQPDSKWVPLLLKHGYIKAKVVPAQTVYE